MRQVDLFVKSRVKAYFRRNGTFVGSYNKIQHPKKNDAGHAVTIKHPSTPTPFENWKASDKSVTVVPDGAVPDALNGIKFSPWKDAPRSDADWDDVPGQIDLDEPAMRMVGHKEESTGVVIQEPDGRVWLMAPTNKFGGYNATFPKGRNEDDMPRQANAIKEAFEESGLQVEITGFLGDVERTTTMTRYYLARRVGGTPAMMGWEAQAVHLVPVHELHKFADSAPDKKVIDMLKGKK